MVYAFNPSTQEAEAGKYLSWRPVLKKQKTKTNKNKKTKTTTNERKREREKERRRGRREEGGKEVQSVSASAGARL